MADSPQFEPETVVLLARSDAICSPVRDWTCNTRVGELLRGQRDFELFGVPYRAGGTGSQRIAFMRKADRLEASGRFVFHRNGSGKRIGWRLPPAEYWRARSWALLSGETELAACMLGILDNVHRGCKFGLHTDPREACPEWALCGDWTGKPASETRRRILTIQESLLPGLTLGFVTSFSVSWLVYYSLTDEGRLWLDDFTGETIKRPTFDDEGTALACKWSDEYREALVAERPDLGDEIRIAELPRNPPRESAAPPILNSDGRVDLTLAHAFVAGKLEAVQ